MAFCRVSYRATFNRKAVFRLIEIKPCGLLKILALCIRLVVLGFDEARAEWYREDKIYEKQQDKTIPNNAECGLRMENEARHLLQLQFVALVCLCICVCA